MKKVFYLLLCGAFVLNTLSAQTADEIVDKYIKANGGLDKLKSIETTLMEGKINAQGMEVGINMISKKNKGAKMVIELMGMKGWTIMTPDSGWIFMPFQGQTKPESMTSEQIKSSIDQLDLEGELVNYKEKGHAVEYLGMDDVEGTDCYKLKVTTKTGNTHYMLIDPTSNYIVRKISKQKADGKEIDVTVDFSNYKLTENGYLFPHTISAMGGPVEFTKVVINGNIDDSEFKPMN
ncbi:MAG: hypothetical protein IT267_07540 [Saprospiraceae bacterium]|nr:hypothetical protein [Saprospiraceae bacterium]